MIETEAKPGSKMESLYKNSDYKLLSVKEIYHNKKKPWSYRLVVTQVCPEGHEITKRWRERLCCGHCAETKVRINEKGVYVDEKDLVSIDVQGLIPNGVMAERRKNGIMSYQYAPSETKLSGKLMMFALRLLKKKD